MTKVLVTGSQSRFERDCRRVLCVVRWPLGGIRTYLLYNYPLLVESGFRFTFLGPADDSFRSLRQEMASWKGAEFVGTPIGRKRHESLWPAVRRQLRTKRFDLVHSQGFTAGLHSLIGGIGTGVPQIVTLHDVLRPIYFRGLTGRVKLRLIGRILKRADALISVSRDVQENLLEYLPSLRKSRCDLVTIPHGVDLNKFSMVSGAERERENLRSQLGLGEDVCLMGFLGRFMEQKGFLPLLDALEVVRRDPFVRRYHLVAVGSGDYAREYRRETERRGLADVVSFREAVANPVPILRQLDLLVMPSLWEAAGLLAMEAMVVGIPVIGSNCIGLREVLEGTPSRTFEVGNVIALSQALKAAIASPWLEEARAFVRTARLRFSGERSSRSLLGLFEGIAKR